MDLGLAGTVALIAGASQGIGLACAGAFRAEGADVVMVARDPERLRAAEQALDSVPGGRILALCGDMTRPDDIGRVIGRTLDQFERLDAVVANVGSGRGKRGLDNEHPDWIGSLETNLVGGMLLAQNALKVMQERGRGCVTFISSIAGLEAIPAPLPYGMAKAAIGMGVKMLARQAGPFNVRVNAVAPGNVWFEGGTWDAKLAHNADEVMGYIKSEVPLARFGTAEEIADLVVFLSSGRAGFITGTTVVADGGQTRSL